ncbi:hypothetical protein EIN_018380 [Entamoeba invadens IP1]|uniref:hypothetical protein n=1 Tax=Entamoeba invadens IP1 TaxID=370355 RepID=UPI0002C3F30C|nr:hypothetical protein EIN_018380 [Entamoeba invadens IP1]ELP90489.1 hypothetical protein EIN_018380 [Entamoeba invadens IP1]|eukprot:XP_004257260.1 hypothetical protein EIN_018380 [Entamoeba invadens IP1]
MTETTTDDCIYDSSEPRKEVRTKFYYKNFVRGFLIKQLIEKGYTIYVVNCQEQPFNIDIVTIEKNDIGMCEILDSNYTQDNKDSILISLLDRLGFCFDYYETGIYLDIADAYYQDSDNFFYFSKTDIIRSGCRCYKIMSNYSQTDTSKYLKLIYSL